ncbi:tRNA dihydrouridine(16) synthase DusC, partial [Vibrio sp. 1640]|nr:tRNA dihydrouridine(16) synthase DusC [Vibrio sp. 1640]
WFAYLRQSYPEANELFREIRTFNKAAPIVEHIQRYRYELQSRQSQVA